MINVYRVPTGVVEDVARGDSAATATGFLRSTRLSRSLLLACRIATDEPGLIDAVAVISRVQDSAVQVASSVLTYPWVSTWASAVVRQGSGDRDYLRAVAVAAALRAGIDDHGLLLAPDSTGRIHLPTLGMLTVGGGRPRAVTRIDLDSERWTPLRVITVQTFGRTAHISLDDLDPYRDCHGHPPADRLGDAAWRSWLNVITQAWQLLNAYAPDDAADLLAGLTSIVPLRRRAAGARLSASCGDAFGGFGATLPADAAECAIDMVHEFSHSKLNTLHELAPLYLPNDDLRYFAPWRPDPRPVGGLLLGAHAFTAVAKLWRALSADPHLAVRATSQFAIVRTQLRDVVPDLLAAPGLTEVGRTLAATLAGEIQTLDRVPLPAHIERAANDHLARLRRNWRQRIALGR